MNNKVKVTKYINGKSIELEMDYIPVKEKRAKGDVIKRLSKKKAKKIKSEKKYNSFYKSREWRELRYRVLRSNEAKCMCCGRSPKKHHIIIHVDHIKPRSKHPELELCFENLQVLCDDCNYGKSNLDSTDWRPSKEVKKKPKFKPMPIMDIKKIMERKK